MDDQPQLLGELARLGDVLDSNPLAGVRFEQILTEVFELLPMAALEPAGKWFEANGKALQETTLVALAAIGFVKLRATGQITTTILGNQTSAKFDVGFIGEDRRIQSLLTNQIRPEVRDLPFAVELKITFWQLTRIGTEYASGLLAEDLDQVNLLPILSQPVPFDGRLTAAESGPLFTPLDHADPTSNDRREEPRQETDDSLSRRGADAKKRVVRGGARPNEWPKGLPPQMLVWRVIELRDVLKSHTADEARIAIRREFPEACEGRDDGFPATNTQLDYRNGYKSGKFIFTDSRVLKKIKELGPEN